MQAKIQFNCVISPYPAQKIVNLPLFKMNMELKEHFNNKMFNGFDMDSTMLRIGAMNLISHYVDNPQIEYRDSLSQQNIDENKYSLILANSAIQGVIRL